MGNYSDLKSEYQDIQNSVAEALSGYEDASENLQSYFTTAVLRVWGAEPLFSPEYTHILNDVLEQDYSMEQIATSLECMRDPIVRMILPDFYNALIEADQASDTTYTDQFLTRFNELMVGMAMANGDFTIKESSCLKKIMYQLIKHARKNGLTVSDLADHSSEVTKRNKDNYLSKEDLPKLFSEDPNGETDGKIHIEITGLEDNEASSFTIDSNYTETPLDELNLQDEQTDETAHPKPVIQKASNRKEETLESLLEELDSMVGLTQVKNDVRGLMNFIRVSDMRKKRGMKVPTTSYHLVFTGNPGTGKTTVARLVAKLYYQIGILPKGQLVETDRSSLVAGYLGQTAIKTQKVIQEALGGVLFIDEAYSLANDDQDSYGREAIETILKAMEDHRDELVVIVAGYTELMHKFIDSNPGLSSRFNKYFEFPDYTGEELLQIFHSFCDKNGYRLHPDADCILKDLFEKMYASRDEHFGNARTVRNIFEQAIHIQANRLITVPDPSDEDLEVLTVSDIEEAAGVVRT